MAGLEASAEAFADAFVSLFTWVLAWWTSQSDPGLAVVKESLAQVWPVVRWVVASILAMALVVAAVTVGVGRKGSDLAVLVSGLGRLLLVLSAGWLVTATAWRLTDGLSNWILAGGVNAKAYGRDLQAALASMEPVVALVLSAVGIAASLSLVAAILVRVIVAFLLAMSLPVIAAFSVVRYPIALRRGVIWLVAVLAFRPLAYAVLRVGHELHETSEDPIVLVLLAVLSLVVCAFLLPVTAQLLAGRWS